MVTAVCMVRQEVHNHARFAGSLSSVRIQPPKSLLAHNNNLPAGFAPKGQMAQSVPTPSMPVLERDPATSVPCAWASILELSDDCPLGSGAFAKIFRVADKSTGEPCAMKVINKPNFTMRGIGGQLDAEVNAMRRTSETSWCRHIVKLFGQCEESDHVYLRMELCQCDLLRYTNAQIESRLCESEAAVWTRQLYLGLRDLHCLGILHRDIKPENLLIAVDGTLRIADFGWCADLRDAPSTLAGTFLYMAPEVLGEHGIQTEAIDVWSAGVTVLQLLTGRPMLTTYLGPGSSGLSMTDPHRATKMKTGWLVAEIAEKCPPPENKRPADVSWRCWDFLRQLLVPNVCERISVADALVHPWLEEAPSQDSSLPSSPGHGGVGCTLQDQDLICSSVPLKDREKSALKSDCVGNVEAPIPAPTSCCRSKTAPTLRPSFAISPRQEICEPPFSARMRAPARTGRVSLALPTELDRGLTTLAEQDSPNFNNSVWIEMNMSSPYDQVTPRFPAGGSVALRAPHLTARQERPSSLSSPMLGCVDALSRTMPLSGFRSTLVSPGSLQVPLENEVLDANAMWHREARRFDPLMRTMPARSHLASPPEHHLCTPRPRPYASPMVSRTPMMPTRAPAAFVPPNPTEAWGCASPKLYNVHRRRSFAS